MDKDEYHRRYINRLFHRLANDEELGARIQTLAEKTMGPWHWREDMQCFARKDIFGNYPQSIRWWADTHAEQLLVDAYLQELGYILVDPPNITKSEA